MIEMNPGFEWKDDKAEYQGWTLIRSYDEKRGWSALCMRPDLLGVSTPFFKRFETREALDEGLIELMHIWRIRERADDTGKVEDVQD